MGVDPETGEEAKKWALVHENYILKEENGVTEVLIDLDTLEEYSDMFNDMWPQALTKLKEITEQAS